MTARAASEDAEAIWVNAPLLGVVADEANGAANVGYDFGNEILRTAPVSYSDDREAFVQKVFEPGSCLLRWVVRRNPSAADHEHDRRAIGVRLRLEHVEGHRKAVFMPVNHIRNDL